MSHLFLFKGLGAFAARRIKRLTCFGPYLGIRHNNTAPKPKSAFSWNVRIEIH